MVGGQALPAPVVVLAQGLQQQGAVGQHHVGGAGGRADLGTTADRLGDVRTDVPPVVQ